MLDIDTNKVGNILQRYYPDRPRKRLVLAAALTDQDKRDIVAKFETGMSANDIAKEYGIKHDTVAKLVINSIGKDRYDQSIASRVGTVGIQKGITPAQAIEMGKLYSAGMGRKQIGQIFGITELPVWYHLNKLPNWLDIRQQHLTNRETKRRGPTVVGVRRAGEVGNLRSKPAGSKHVHGVKWR